LELTKDEEAALKGEMGETLELAYRILVATGEATDAEKLIRMQWAHVSGVYYNTIGDAGVDFLSELSKEAKVKVKTTVNPMGFDSSNVSQYGLDEEFIKNKKISKIPMKKWGQSHPFHVFPTKFSNFLKKILRFHLLKQTLQFM
jgi:predicted aconitase